MQPVRSSFAPHVFLPICLNAEMTDRVTHSLICIVSFNRPIAQTINKQKQIEMRSSTVQAGL